MRNNYRHNNVKYLYILSMVIAFIPRVGNIQFSKNIQLAIGSIWIICISIKYLLNIRRAKKKNSEVKWMIKSYLVPSLVIHAWTIILMILGIISWKYFTTNITTYIPTLLAIGSVYLFKKEAFRINFIALASAYIISVLSSAIIIGPTIFVDAFTDVLYNRKVLSINYLELHDIVLSIGFVLTYYIFSTSKLTKRNISIIFVTIIIMTLGMKRASLLGVFIAVVFHAVVKRLKEKNQYKVCKVAGIIGIFACFFFVWVLINGSSLWEIVSRLGINPRGRSYYWTALAERCNFSPTFLGLGRNYSYLLFAGELSYMKVGAAHSDILKMYAENGFFIFTYWLWHYLYRMTTRYKNRYSMNSALIYFGLTIYLFAMYLTDNVETYFASIIISITIPMCHAIKNGRNQLLETKIKPI